MLLTAQPPLFLVMDLGSNSFHLLLAQYQQGWQILVEQRHQVGLLSGISSHQMIAPQALARAVDAAKAFAPWCRLIPARFTRAVGTHAFRSAANASECQHMLENILDLNMTVLNGEQEARLIYLGVTGHNPPLPLGDNTLVVDIGGGSTEIVVGSARHVHLAKSMALGCVTLSEACFTQGMVTQASLQEAETIAQTQLQPIAQLFTEHGFSVCLGSSGTITTTLALIRTLGIHCQNDCIEPIHLDRLVQELLQRDSQAQTTLLQQRMPVFAGGLAILRSIFYCFKLPKMWISPSNLREGLLQHLLEQQPA